MMIPLRTPIKISSTPMTIASAIRKLIIKPLTVAHFGCLIVKQVYLYACRFFRRHLV
jgi:hypothetical protein